MIDLNEVIQKLKRLNQPVPNPMQLPSSSDIENMEAQLGIEFSADFKHYLLHASNITFGCIEPVTISNPQLHTYLPTVISDAKVYGLPDDLLPVCEDNSDFYCLNENDEVVFWSHNGLTNEKWANLAEWIQKVWIEESQE